VKEVEQVLLKISRVDSLKEKKNIPRRQTPWGRKDWHLYRTYTSNVIWAHSGWRPLKPKGIDSWRVSAPLATFPIPAQTPGVRG